MEDIALRATPTYRAGLMQAAGVRRINQFFAQLLKPYGLTPAQWFMIGLIYDAQDNGVRISDVAHELGTGLPLITNTANVLEKRAIVSREASSADARSRLLIIAPDFRPRCAEIERTLREHMAAALFPDVDPADLRTYLKVLNQLARVQDTTTKSDA